MDGNGNKKLLLLSSTYFLFLQYYNTMQSNAAANTLTKSSIIHLYRRCIRSVHKIESASQRGTYLIYTRDGFRANAHLPRKARDTLLAYRDGLEQVENMEYYQRMAHTSHNNDGQNAVPSTPSNSTLNSNVFDSASPPHHQNNEKKILSSSNEEIPQWLMSQLPHLNKEDVENYTQCLIDDGFDSEAFIYDELTEEDLSFMKKAHKRVLMRQIMQQKGEGNDE